MISKVWLDTIWFVAGKSDRKERLFDKAWLRTVRYPYYAGHGYALSLGKWSVRIGVCTPLYNDVNLDDEGEVLDYSVMAQPIDVEPKDVGEWGSSEAEQNHESAEQEANLPQSVPIESVLLN